MEKKRLTTKEAAKFLSEVEGFPVTPGTLEVWRCKGRGPVYRKIYNRVLYEVPALQDFAAGRLVKTTW